MATAFGYLVYLIRVSVAGRPRVVERMSQCGADGLDLFDLVNQSFEAMGQDVYRSETKTAEGFRRKKFETSGRSTWVKIYKGPAGIEGETYDMDTGESIPTGERQALLSGLRALIILPSDSYYGLLFVERIGRRHLKEVIDNWVLKPAAFTLRESIIRLEGFAEASDWQLVLAEKQVLQVSELLKSASGDDASTAEDKTVKVTITGGSLRALTDRFKGMIIDRVNRKNDRARLITESARLEAKRLAAERHTAGDDAFTVEDTQRLEEITARLLELDTHTDRSIAELINDLNPVENPADQGLEHSSYEVSLGGRRPERVFSVERDSMPQFVYETGRRLSDSELWSAWVSHAETILNNRGVSLPTGWVGDDPTAT